MAEGKRVALVIGNGHYRNAGELINPKNDAADVAETLRKLGFIVIEGIDLDKTPMDRAIRDFAEAMAGAQMGLFFYAGHGLQVNGQNYLMPIDARLTTASGLDFEMVRLDLVQRVMEREAGINVIILDACRDNPLGRNLARALGTRSSVVAGGLAPMESGQGTLIIYSTQPGNVALDGAGRNSPFSAALLKHIIAPGEDLPTILINVRNDVMAATGRRQVPWEHSALTAKVYFTPPKPAPFAGPTPDQQMELAFWESVKDSSNPAVLRSYLEQYPQGNFAPLARALIEQHEKQQAAEEKQRAAEQAARQEAAKQAEIKQLDDGRKTREAALAEERKRAEGNKNAAEAKRLAEQQQTEQLKRTEELKKLLEEVRVAREAARIAEEQRQAALKAADDARKTAETSKAKQGETSRTVVAALPKLDNPAPQGAFDGTWTISQVSATCTNKAGSYSIVVAGSSVVGGRRGRVSPSGSVRWNTAAQTDGASMTWTGTFRGRTGSGTYSRDDGKCGGSFTARRG